MTDRDYTLSLDRSVVSDKVLLESVQLESFENILDEHTSHIQVGNEYRSTFRAEYSVVWTEHQVKFLCEHQVDEDSQQFKALRTYDRRTTKQFLLNWRAELGKTFVLRRKMAETNHVSLLKRLRAVDKMLLAGKQRFEKAIQEKEEEVRALIQA